MSRGLKFRRKKLLAVGCWLSALLLLSGCILVEDFSPQWQKGKEDSCINKIAESLYYSEFRRDPADKDMSSLAHSFTLGDMHFLMLKKNAEDAGGRMYRFGVVNGIFQRYRLDPVMRDAFEIEFPDAPVSLKQDTVKLATLGKAEMALLTEISSRNDYWEIEDQTLYNPLRNPLCQFDDRDLTQDEPKPAKTKPSKP